MNSKVSIDPQRELKQELRETYEALLKPGGVSAEDIRSIILKKLLKMEEKLNFMQESLTNLWQRSYNDAQVIEAIMDLELNRDEAKNASTN